MNSLAILLACLAAAPAASQTVCTDSTKLTACGVRYCNFPVSNRGDCTLKWALNDAIIPFLCETNNVTGTCEQCPPGWTAKGAFCVECESFKSCNRDGVVSCNGACSARNYPKCDPATSFVTCESCFYNDTVMASLNRRVTRGGILDAPDLCSAYFECTLGFYLSLGSSQQLTCQPCQVPEPVPANWEIVSHGLTFGDKYSCVYKPLEAKLAPNALGQYGNISQSCPLLYTSQPGMARSQSDCVPCPLTPVFGGFSSSTFDCRPVCQSGRVRRGELCVPEEPSMVDCEVDGYFMLEEVCTPSSLPWTPLDTYATGEASVSVQPRSEAWDAVDAQEDFRVKSAAPNQLWRPSLSRDFCAGLVSNSRNLAYVQDLPLFTYVCSETEKHTFYMLVKGSKYLYAFLERSFGNNNRFVLWQVQIATQGQDNAGQVWQTWRLPAKVCSAVVVPAAAGGDVLYFAFCNATFVSYVNARDYMGGFGGTSDVKSATAYFLNRVVGVLIGKDEPGKADGMKDQALFRGPLSLATTADPARLLLADRDNCRIVELVVSSPGSFLVRATTVGDSGCFSGAFPLPFPRLLTSVLGGSVALFVTDGGLVQLDSRLRSFVYVLRAGALSSAMGNVLWIAASPDGTAVRLHNVTHVATLTMPVAACPSRSVARVGGACRACPSDLYYASNGTCRLCSVTSCPSGFYLSPCTAAQDGKCLPCAPVSVPYTYRFGPDCQVVPQYPCPSGYYGPSAGDCSPCGLGSKLDLPWYGVCQCLGFSLSGNGTSCVVASPFAAGLGPFQVPSWISAWGCRYDLDANCTDFGCYLQQAYPRSCLPCPAGSVSVGGLYCQACSGFRQPNPSRDLCVCTPPAYLASDGVSCVCPQGHAAGGSQGCVPCPAGSVQEGPLVLPENYQAYAQGACTPCSPGLESAFGAVVCRACTAGKYRELGMPACSVCNATAAAYALDPARRDSCTLCSARCDAGQRWTPCPVSQGLYVCQACPALSGAMSWVSVGENRNCLWQCNAGYYEYNGRCWPCTVKQCPFGSKYTPCSRYEDSHCRVPCVNATKPLEYARWAAGCTWECEAGYRLVKKEFAGWSEYACEAVLQLPWSIFW